MNCIARKEPSHLQNFKNNLKNKDSSNKDRNTSCRGDLEVIMGNKHFILDVAVVTPNSYCHNKAKKGDKYKALVYANTKANSKISKHGANALRANAKFIPFVMESQASRWYG